MAAQKTNELLSSLPQVEEVLRHPQFVSLQEEMPRVIVVESVRAAIQDIREEILAGTLKEVDAEAIAETALRRARLANWPSLRRVINATGVILHTNLGRSPLADEALDAMVKTAGSYSTLEYNTEEMGRGSRQDHYEDLICLLTGAEAAFAVNNNAAAVLLVLSEFAAHKEAVVSRGELVEIGGSFRIPDIMECSQATMVEVGCTNKTHLEDFEQAITENTGLLVKVHTSNYRMVGFTDSVSAKDLCALAHEERQRRIERAVIENEEIARRIGTAYRNTKQAAGAREEFTKELVKDIFVYEDLGSGALVKLAGVKDADEPTVSEAVAAGCDLVSFSGDKLLGGPQAGILVGSAELIARLKKNPLARAMRLDKMSLAALEATLRLYLKKEQALTDIPVLRMLSSSVEDVRRQADGLYDLFEKDLPAGSVALSVISESSLAGGGALPGCDITSFAVKVKLMRGNVQSCAQFLEQEWSTPIIARIKKDALLFDPRTLLDESEVDEIVRAMTAYLKTVG